MKTYLYYAITAALLGSLQIASAAEVSGKITLKGTPKPEVPIDLGPTCGKINPSKPTTRHYVVGKDGGLANVFVYVKKEGLKAPPSGVSPVLDQVGCMYEPYVFGIVTGQKLKIKNSDKELHNIHATPDPKSGNKEFNIGQPPGTLEIEKTFESPEVLVRIKCDVHPWMTPMSECWIIRTSP
jgi:plastocyanin